MVRKQDQTLLPIGALAHAAGVGVETVRYYQRRGLIAKPERPGNARHGSAIRRYDEDVLRQLRFIRSAQTAGFTLDEIGELMALDATDDRSRARALAFERIAALDVKISKLKRARRSLARLADACSASNDGPCPILTAFEQA